MTVFSDAMRWRAIRALPRDLNAKLYVMYLQALEECDDGKVPESALGLLDIEEHNFYALAKRAGVNRSYKYRVYRALMGDARVGDDNEPVPQDRVVTEPTASAATPAPRRRSGSKMAKLLAAATPRPTALYRWYDDQDRLLYVGISDELSGRVIGHTKESSWMDFAARSTITRYPCREDGAEAEIEAIKTEQPLFNQVHNNAPAARRRLVEYLVEHDRLDLLTPAVSRA